MRHEESLAEKQHVIEILEINEDADEHLCVICLDKEKDSVFYPCGHQCTCMDCGERFKKEARH